MLQWGRRLSTAETLLGGLGGLETSAASMGPPSLNGGNVTITSTTYAATEPLQWGRRLSTAETPAQDHLIRSKKSRLQWGRRLSTAETPHGARRHDGRAGRFNGAAVSQRRKRHHSTPGALQHPRFNGAAVSQRRKPAWRRRASCSATGLQWGRRLSTAETRERVGFFLGDPQLQWGRRLSTAETRVRSSRTCQPIAASMGPPSLNGGNGPREPRGICGMGASMGPPSLNGGNVSPRSRRTASRGFNGAAVSQRRKLLEERPRDAHIDASMGPPSLNGGNRRCSPKTNCSSSCFNGAAVSQRRKRAAMRAALLEEAAASMGPPSLNGGNGTMDRSPLVRAGRFNGAAVSQRRKRASVGSSD